MTAPKSDQDKANETMGGLIVLIIIAVAGYFGWQWMSDDSECPTSKTAGAFEV